jgi:hypothetical protein
MKKYIILILLFSSLSSFSGDLYMQLTNEDKGIFSELSEEFFGTDKSDGQFTQGILLSWTESLDEGVKLEYSFQQDLYTPGHINKDQETASPGDRAFSGYLALGINYNKRVDSSIERLQWLYKVEASAGVIGTAAEGQPVQDAEHRLIGADEYRGWDDQLSNRYGGGVVMRFIPRYYIPLAGKIGLELAPHGVVALGNFVSYQGVGGSLRLGRALQKDYGAADFSPFSIKNPMITDAEGFVWNLFVGLERRRMDRNYLLEGLTSHTHQRLVSIEEYLTDVHVGVNVFFKDIHCSVVLVQRGIEFREQLDKQQFVTAGIGYQF